MFFKDIWQVVGWIGERSIFMQDRMTGEDWESFLLPEQEKITRGWKMVVGVSIGLRTYV